MRGLLLGLVLFSGCAVYLPPTRAELLARRQAEEAENKQRAEWEQKSAEFAAYALTRPPAIQTALSEGKPILGMVREDLVRMNDYWDARWNLEHEVQPSFALIGERLDNGVKHELWLWCELGKRGCPDGERIQVSVKDDAVVALQRGTVDAFTVDKANSL
jgi:hypothetical protein